MPGFVPGEVKMAQGGSRSIRNVALVGQAGSGKTLLADSLAFLFKASKRIGRIEDGNTLSDADPEEIKHKHSIALTLLALSRQDLTLNVLDTPGVADFIGEVQSALSAVEMCIFVVSAAEPIGPDADRIWELLDQAAIPRLIFVNKADRERADYFATVDTLKEHFGAGVAPLELPIGIESSFRGVVDILSDRALVYQNAPVAEEVPVPKEIEDLEHSVHEQLVEGIVVADDALMERYLAGETLSFQELEMAMARGVKDATVFPVIVGSAVKEIGIDRLVDFIAEIGSGPEASEDPKEDVEIQIFKTFADPFMGKLSLAKVRSGVLRPSSALTNLRTQSDERIGQLFTLLGKEHLPLEYGQRGDIVALSKLSGAKTADVLSKNRSSDAKGITFEPSLLVVAVTPVNSKDDEKLFSALLKLAEEDPTLSISRDPRSHKALVAGQGEAHISIALERAARKFGVEATYSEPEIPYLESITAEATAEGKYKKQTGGHGQYGVANIRIRPLARGEGFSFLDEIVGGAIPRNFIPAVEKGIQEAMAHGGHFGFPVVDVAVHLVDGKYHPVDSSEMSFKMAGSLAFHEAFAQSSPVVLEPIDEITVIAPAKFQGDILGDLNSKRAKVSKTDLDPETKRATLIALVPRSEMKRYATDLRAITSGQGRFTLHESHYEIAPPTVVSKLQPRKDKPNG